MSRKPRQRDLDLAVVRAAPAVCDEVLKRLRDGVPDPGPYAANAYVIGHRVAWDRAIELVEAFKRECS